MATKDIPFQQTRSISRRINVTVILISTLFLVEVAGLYFSNQAFVKGVTQLYAINMKSDYLEKIRQVLNSVEERLQSDSGPEGTSIFFNAAEKQFEQLFYLALAEDKPDIKINPDYILKAQSSINEILRIGKLPSKGKKRTLGFVARQFALEARENILKARIEMTNLSNEIFNNIYRNRFLPLIASSALGVFLLIVALILGLNLSKRIRFSLDNILLATKIVASGDLNFRAKIIEPDELGALTDSFNKMTENLFRSTVSRDYIAGIIESMMDAVLVLNSQGTILSANQMTTRTFGFSNGDLIGQPIQKIFPPGFQFNNQAQGLETQVITPTGKNIDVSVSISHLVSQGLETDRFVCVLRDITAMKRVETELRERNVDLANANRELEAFSYSVSHDLRSPLRSVDGFSQALLEDCGDQLNDIGKDYLARIRAGVQRMGHLIDDLLNLSRITRSAIQPVSINLSHIVAEIIDDLRSKEPDRQVFVKIQPDVKVWADAALIRVAMENLLNNAWKYTSKHPTANIEFGVQKDQGRLVYFVKDDGAGFDMTYSEKMFGAFQRLHTTNEFPGIGIGLATVQRVIHRHGGTIWAKGAPDKGATFYFTLGGPLL